MKLRLAAAAGCLAVLTACGNNTVADEPTPTALTSEPPSSAADVVVSIVTLGGYTTPQWQASSQPQLVLTGDGTVYVPGAVAEIYPGPMTYPVMTGHLDEEQVQQLLDRAKADGLLSDAPRYKHPMVTDMPDTTVAITVDGKTWTHTAYALGFEPETGPRKVLNDFVTYAAELATPVATEAYEPQSLIVNSFRAPKGDQGGEVAPTKQLWPDGAELKLTDFGCGEVTDAATVATLVEANQLSYFTQGKKTWSLAARAVIPGDRGCPTS